MYMYAWCEPLCLRRVEALKELLEACDLVRAQAGELGDLVGSKECSEEALLRRRAAAETVAPVRRQLDAAACVRAQGKLPILAAAIGARLPVRLGRWLRCRVSMRGPLNVSRLQARTRKG